MIVTIFQQSTLKLMPWIITLAFLVTLATAFTAEAQMSKVISSPGLTTYYIDPIHGDDAKPVGKPWKNIARVNAIQLAPGDRVVIEPGLHEGSLKPWGEGTAEQPIVIQFKAGVHVFGAARAIRLPMFVSNSCDAPEIPKPIGILVQNVKHLRVEGGGVTGPGKTTILYADRMVEVFNDHSEDVTYSGLIFDLQRSAVSEFGVLETGANTAVIQIAEHSDYSVTNAKFTWLGDWGNGRMLSQEAIPKEGRCWRSRPPPGWNRQGQSVAKAADLGGRKIRLDFGHVDSGLTAGHQYQFRLTSRDLVGVHNARCKDITFRDCDFYAFPNMGCVSQFTENITFQRVNVAPPIGTFRTCAAWADIFQFSNCRGEVLVDSCRLSGMQDDAVNCHGTHLRVIERTAENQLLIRFMHPQTRGFAPYASGDVIAVINHANLREYANNPRRKVVEVEAKTDTDWLVTLDGPAPDFKTNDVLDNITWHPNFIARNNHIDMDPVRGFLITTRGRVLVDGNTFWRCAMPGLLIENDAEGWYESGPVRDMLVRGNQFINCGIEINPRTHSENPDEPVHENILIENNYFKDSGVSARNVRGLAVIGNRFSQSTLPVRVSFCTNLNFSGNTYGANK